MAVGMNYAFVAIAKKTVIVALMRRNGKSLKVLSNEAM